MSNDSPTESGSTRTAAPMKKAREWWIAFWLGKGKNPVRRTIMDWDPRKEASNIVSKNYSSCVHVIEKSYADTLAKRNQELEAKCEAHHKRNHELEREVEALKTELASAKNHELTTAVFAADADLKLIAESYRDKLAGILRLAEGQFDASDLRQLPKNVAWLAREALEKK